MPSTLTLHIQMCLSLETATQDRIDMPAYGIRSLERLKSMNTSGTTARGSNWEDKRKDKSS